MTSSIHRSCVCSDPQQAYNQIYSRLNIVVIMDSPSFASEYEIILGALILLMIVVYGGFTAIKGEIPTRVR